MQNLNVNVLQIRVEIEKLLVETHPKYFMFLEYDVRMTKNPN